MKRRWMWQISLGTKDTVDWRGFVNTAVNFGLQKSRELNAI